MKGNPNNFITLANAADLKIPIPVDLMYSDTLAQKVSFCLNNKSLKISGIVSAGTLAAKRCIQNFRNKVFVIGIPRELGRSS